MFKKILLLFLSHCILMPLQAKTLQFSNLTWEVREGFGQIGPNHWSSNTVWVDEKGWLHLKITQIDGKWYCSELATTTKFGFGHYYFSVIGKVDELDPNVVLGLFNYPQKQQQPDETHEIDIEFSKWGSTNPKASNISYTVWPSVLEKNKTTLSFSLALEGNYSSYGFTWKDKSIFFQGSHGHYNDYRFPIISWLFEPPNYLDYIPQQPLPVHINLWLLNGKAPTNNKDIELIIEKFCFKSLDGKQHNCS